MPSQVRLFPTESTAMQNEADGHETAVRPSFGSITVWEDHEDPFQVRELWNVTAIQNDAEEQETASTSS